MTAFVIFIIVFTTLGNLTTIVAVRVDQHLRSVSNLHIASLATADLIVGSVVMTFMLIYNIALKGMWTPGPFLCDTWTWIDYVSCTASLTNVCVIAEDRYQAMSRPLKAIRKRTKRRALLFVGCAWAFPILFWTLMIAYLRITNGRPPDGKCYLLWDPPYLALITASTVVYFPIIIILALFVSIMVVLKRNMIIMEYKMRRSQSVKGRTSSSKTTRKARSTLPSTEAGGISFNPTWISASHEDETVMADSRRSKYDTWTSSEMSDDDLEPAYYSVSIQQEKERIGRPFYRQGRLYRSVSTSTSPERYGLVRTIGTNTSPTETEQSNTQQEKTATALQTVQAEVHCSDPHPPGEMDADLRKDTGTESQGASAPQDVVSSTSGVCSDSDSISKTVTESVTSSVRMISEATVDSDSDVEIVGPKRRRYASLLREKRHTHMERSRLKQQLSAAKTLGTIMTFLLLCWLPFSTLWPLRVFCTSCVSQKAYDISIWINYINSSINPIIYCLCNPNFKRAFQRILTRKRA